MNPQPDELYDRKESADQRSPVLPPIQLPPTVGCVLTLLLGILGAVLLAQLFRFMLEGEIFLGGDEVTASRIWIIRQSDVEGIGISRRKLASEEVSEGESCVITETDFYLWKSDGSATSVTYCECYQQGDFGLERTRSCESDT